MKTAKEYRAFKAAVAEFFAREQIENLSSGYLSCPECNEKLDMDGQNGPECAEHGTALNEPFFTWRACECCGGEAGNREHATGYNREADTIQEYDVCEDCIYYAEYGQLDDTSMMDIEDDKKARAARAAELWAARASV